MARIEIIVPADPRRWHAETVRRLRDAGHEVGVTRHAVPSPIGAAAELILEVEGRMFMRGIERLAARAHVDARPVTAPELRLDLSDHAPPSPLPTMTLRPTLRQLLSAIVDGQQPDLVVTLDGRPVASAAPMIDDRFIAARGLDDVLARAVTLIVATVNRWPALDALSVAPELPKDTGFLGAFLFKAAPRTLREFLRRRSEHFAHWRVGYRLHDGPGVAETGRLGTGWAVLPDDGTHFYADPFPLTHEGRHYIFVEDYPHATGKAVIAVSEILPDGSATAPVPVIEEAHHLSYPQVFERDGEVWMIPEASAGREVVLYRALELPHRWRREAVLIADREISDATLLDHGNRLWLIATERDGRGSTSDTMVVFSAQTLTGPWTAHPQNPIRIDRAAARPGGAFVRMGDELLLPVQDGSLRYGGGLGLARIHELTPECMRIGRPAAIDTTGDWPYPMIHTLNRSGRLEVIDGIARVRRR